MRICGSTAPGGSSVDLPEKKKEETTKRNERKKWEERGKKYQKTEREGGEERENEKTKKTRREEAYPYGSRRAATPQRPRSLRYHSAVSPRSGLILALGRPSSALR